MPTNIDGSWGPVQDWPLIGLHAIVMDDGRVLTFGTDSSGMQGGQFIYDIYDPVTGTHETLENTTPTDIFCSAAVIIPGTNKILIAGGDARPLGAVNRGVADVNILDMDTGELYPAPEGDMAFQRWYPTMVSLPDGRMVMLGGTDINGRGISTPEIYTYGEGWQSLTGGIDTDLASSSLYPRAFVNDDGNIIYFATGRGNDSKVEVMSLDPSGNGSLTQIGTMPFSISWDAPSVMYDDGKILVQDSQTGLWSVDINGDTPTFTQVGTLSQQRNWSNMTTLADGTVLINGGTSNGNKEAGSDKTAIIWDPETNTLDYTVDEANPRLYHSASVLLNDGTLLSLGGGASGGSENNYLDGQVYRPPYLYDDSGNLADRPVIIDAPFSVAPGESFSIAMDDVSDIARITLVKSGAATHAFNMNTRFVELDFTVNGSGTIDITMPELAGGVSAGSWMLFAWDNDGVPSIAPMVNVSAIAMEGWDYNPDNLLVNGTFEHPEKDSSAYWQNFANDEVPGWTNAADNLLQLVVHDDQQTLDLDAALKNDNIYQDVQTEAGMTYILTFDVVDAQAGTSDFDVLWNGEIISRVTADGPENFEFAIEGTGGNDRLAFREIASQSDRIGAHIDNVTLVSGEEQGEEVFDVPNQTQFVNGVGNSDVFVIAGDSSDYGWGPTEDGKGIVVWGPTGHDLLYGFEAIRFADTTVSLAAEEHVYHDVAYVTEYLTGTSDQEETFVINGNSTDYGWGATEDGQGVVVWGPTGHDLLYDIEKIEFNDTTVFLTSQYNEHQDTPNLTQYLTGTSGETDRFVVDGNSNNYGWGTTDDGKGIVVWGPTGHDLLYDFEEIEFNDQVVQLEQGTV